MSARLMIVGIAVAAVLVVLGSCAAKSTPEQLPQIKTASDMTDVDRRARLRMELAGAYFGRGQSTTALDEVKQALVAKPDMPEAYNLRGLIYANLGQPQLAEESFQRGLQLNPKDADAMHNFGWFLCQERRFPEAEALFERAMQQPQYRDVPRTLLARGLCEARAGDLAKAERTLTRSYELDANNPATAFNLGEVLFRLQEFERARFYLRRVNAQPATANAQTLWLAARIEQQLGNPAGARAFGEQLQERYPQSPETMRYERGQFQ
ncbi:MAG: type IV pilus biogenesis/stability protein PilW [Rubrivivax sp.]